MHKTHRAALAVAFFSIFTLPAIAAPSTVQTAAGGLISVCQTSPEVTAANGGTGSTTDDEQCFNTATPANPVLGAGAIQIGDGARATNAGDIVMGAGASTLPRANNYIAVDNAIAIGTQAFASFGGIAFGPGAVAQHNSMAFGPNSQAWASGGIAIGSGAQVGSMGRGSVAIGQDSIASGSMEVSVGDIGTERRITNMAAGLSNTDAVNIAQFNDGATAIASWLGGGAAYSAGLSGSFSQPTFPIQGFGYSDVASAFAAVDSSITDLYDRVSASSGGTPGPVGPQGPQGPAGPSGSGGMGTDPLAVHYDSTASAAVTLQGVNGTQIRNIAAGTAGTDATNVDQLQEALRSAKTYTDIRSANALVQANQYTDMRVAGLNARIDYALAAATSNANAAAAVAAQDPTHHNRVAVSNGLSSGVNAWTFMYQHKGDSGLTWNASLTGEQGGGSSSGRQVGVGIGYSW